MQTSALTKAEIKTWNAVNKRCIINSLSNYPLSSLRNFAERSNVRSIIAGRFSAPVCCCCLYAAQSSDRTKVGFPPVSNHTYLIPLQYLANSGTTFSIIQYMWDLQTRIERVWNYQRRVCVCGNSSSRNAARCFSRRAAYFVLCVWEAGKERRCWKNRQGNRKLKHPFSEPLGNIAPRLSNFYCGIMQSSVLFFFFRRRLCLED